MAAYRIAQEALTNAVRHARAGRCTIRLRRDAADGALVVEVADDGCGIAPGRAAGVGLALDARAGGGAGRIVRRRTGAGGGTRVCARLPCPQPGAAARGSAG